jgi:hypothetical protein
MNGMKVEINEHDLEIEGSSGYVVITYKDEYDGILKIVKIQKDDNIDVVIWKLFDVFFPEFVGKYNALTYDERKSYFNDIREILRQLILPEDDQKQPTKKLVEKPKKKK